MCGIAGIIYRDRNIRAEGQLLADMCAVIHHRGPDEWGSWVQENVGIGMTRLQIIDLAGGSQPIHNETRSKWIVFNGEIYNYRELRSDLEKRGHVFYTSSDTETILHLYEEYQEDCVQYLRGMFAFAIWDGDGEQLFLARDRLGIKPLHYFQDGKRFAFGSEIKSILKCPGVPREVHTPALVNYAAYGYVPDPDTMFQGIKKLPPGHLLVYRKGETSVRKYWDVKYLVDEGHPEEYYLERTRELLDEAVRMRLMSEVPLGAFLSGGIDSSLVVAFMAQQMSEPVKTFSIGFEQQQYNELPYARMVAERYGTDHHEEIVKADAEVVIKDLVRQFDEPFADSSSIPTYYVSKMAKKHVTVVLSGDGGDELFGGYGRYGDGSLARCANLLPLGLRRPLFLGTTRLMPEWFPGINTLRHLALDADGRYIRKVSGGLSTVFDAVFSRDLKARVMSVDPATTMLQHLEYAGVKDDLSRRQYLDTKTYLPGDILTKVDRTSMLVSLEARVPLLDHKLVEFAATIPPRFKVRGNNKKYVLKRLAENLIPHEAIYRPKMGFAIPVRDWINNEWREMSQELVFGERARARGYFNSKHLDRIISEHRWGRRDHSSVIWSLMVLELWHREMVDGQS